MRQQGPREVSTGELHSASSVLATSWPAHRFFHNDNLRRAQEERAIGPQFCHDLLVLKGALHGRHAVEPELPYRIPLRHLVSHSPRENHLSQSGHALHNGGMWTRVVGPELLRGHIRLATHERDAFDHCPLLSGSSDWMVTKCPCRCQVGDCGCVIAKVGEDG